MLRKLIVAAAIGVCAVAFVPATTWAGGGYHGYRHHGYHRHGGFHGWRGHHFHRPIFASCWRWVPTRFGYAKIWVCR